LAQALEDCDVERLLMPLICLAEEDRHPFPAHGSPVFPRMALAWHEHRAAPHDSTSIAASRSRLHRATAGVDLSYPRTACAALARAARGMPYMRAAFAPSTLRTTRSGSDAIPSSASRTAPGKCPSKCGKSDAQMSTSSPIRSTSG